MKAPRLPAGTSALLLFPLFVAGCGSGSDGTSPMGTGGTAAAQGGSADTVAGTGGMTAVGVAGGGAGGADSAGGMAGAVAAAGSGGDSSRQSTVVATGSVTNSRAPGLPGRASVTSNQ